ncbi:hypothetical protein ACFQFC_13760 [Amorphoplanes digitatis]|uniref:Uncharacterized protein n=1 Tax=Actinoplanes digitatis TaxID=1868 RepID=A0A7W7I2I4_9ACTN|nr:hypothetical protein [Actinoplanes digitatis]MBB4765269.1 hypothetical protein [Actinoplanes digitatis]BFE75050.1 hypothetical protein GCM10020092_083510 [Actinoplanes digitatis]GID94722.1 hypothetical protein Adi01nite_41340 [Actinoplanes digitatis]
MATIGLFAALAAAGSWASDAWGWPDGLVIPAIAVPYWAAVTAVWSRWGPEMPGLH